MPGETNQKTEPQKVIVVERRSLLADFAGIWLVAIPVFVALLVCLPRKDQVESPRSELNLPATGWSRPSLSAKPRPGSDTGSGLNSATESSQATTPVKVNRIEITDQPREKQGPAEGGNAPLAEKPKPAEVIQMPRGVIVLNNSVNNLNPVAVFDPRQDGAGQPATAENAGDNKKQTATDNKS
ncbi:MAG: hypothetical protein ACKO85_13030, partial [Isosphaeraceae bacterium]